jgi:archaellum component FlaC
MRAAGLAEEAGAARVPSFSTYCNGDPLAKKLFWRKPERRVVMHYGRITIAVSFALALLSGACNRESRETSVDRGPTASADRAAELQRERNDEITRLNDRVTEIEREYGEATQQVESGKRTATAGLREELKEDVANIKTAVHDLSSTTPDNWWGRHEQAMRRTADDIEADVARFAGKVTPAKPSTTSDDSGETVSTEPFTSRRDKFVADMRARVDAMDEAMDGIKAKGAQETEIEDVRARVKKLGDDVDRLRTASADDWWDVTKARVTEYVERVEQSVDRLDNNKG